jgi:hypothetical protein
VENCKICRLFLLYTEFFLLDAGFFLFLPVSDEADKRGPKDSAYFDGLSTRRVTILAAII